MVNTASPTADFNRVEVRGKYIGWDASLIGGSVTFTPRVARAVDTAVATIIIARPIDAAIDNAGACSALLPAGDDPQINVSFTYKVVENFPGGDTYDIAVPIAAEATGLDLATVPRTYPVDASAGPPLVSLAAFNAYVAGASLLAATPMPGTAYTLALGDTGKVIEASNAAASTVTVPTDAAAPFPVGTMIEVDQLGTGQVTLAPAAGVTLNSRGGTLKSAGQYAVVTLRKRAANVWVVTGDTA